MEKGMATHSSVLAWRIPWMEEPGGLQSMGSQGVGHGWATNTRRKKRQLQWKQAVFPWPPIISTCLLCLFSLYSIYLESWPWLNWPAFSFFFFFFLFFLLVLLMFLTISPPCSSLIIHHPSNLSSNVTSFLIKRKITQDGRERVE